MSLLRSIAEFIGIPPQFLPNGFQTRSLLSYALKIILIPVVIAIVLTSFIQVETNQVGVVLRFGKWVRTEPPGFHLKLPFPIESVQYPVVTSINRVGIFSGSESTSDFKDTRFQQNVEDDVIINNAGLMLTGDTNIVDIDFSVLWRIKNAGYFLFNIDDPKEKLVALSESIVRDIVAQDSLENILTGGRQNIEITAQRDIQSILDKYNSGIEIIAVKLHRADPPRAVISDFRDVQAAAADRERTINEAEGYANDILPKARGEADVLINTAKAYKESKIKDALGMIEAWTLVAEQYKLDPKITKKRLYIEFLSEILSKLNKVVITNPDLKPYIILNGLDPIKKYLKIDSK